MSIFATSIAIRAQERTLIDFIWACDPDAVRRAVAHGANPDVKDSEGRSALHVAALACPSSDEEAIALLEAGADPNSRMKGGDTPLHLAAYRHAAAMIRVLLVHGADPTALNDRKATPLDSLDESKDAAWLGPRHEIEGLLLKVGAERHANPASERILDPGFTAAPVLVNACGAFLLGGLLAALLGANGGETFKLLQNPWLRWLAASQTKALVIGGCIASQRWAVLAVAMGIILVETVPAPRVRLAGHVSHWAWGLVLWGGVALLARSQARESADTVAGILSIWIVLAALKRTEVLRDPETGIRIGTRHWLVFPIQVTRDR